MALFTSLGIIILTSVVIYYAGKYFSEASSLLGDHFGLPRSVKGATFDAISSSLPELLVALFSVISFHKFEVGLGTVVGSALFNLLIIPGLAVLVAPVAFKVSKKVVSREAVFYIIAVVALIVALIITQTWGLIIPLALLGLYVVYVYLLARDVSEHKKKAHHKQLLKRPFVEVSILIFTAGIIALASYFLTEHAILLSNFLHIHPFIIAFTVVAAATSVPDTVISVLNARKGDIDDATSNVFGSNIFDILVGLSIPLIIAYFILGPTTILFSRMELLGLLLVATLFVYVVIKRKYELTKTHAWIFLASYGAILGYVVFLVMNNLV